MIAVAHVLAIAFYVGAAALAAAPFARPMAAPVRGVIALLALGVMAHAVGLLGFAGQYGQAPLSGIGPSLSFASVLVALSLLAAEVLASEVSLSLVAAPLAAVIAIAALAVGLVPGHERVGARGVWLSSHVALSFIGIAGFATAAAAGVVYLVERRELKSRRFGAVFRFFPPLETLDRVNHVAAVVGWLALTPGIVLAVTYSLAFRALNVPQLVWGLAAWMAVTALTFGRLLGGWRARRAAVAATVSFAAVVALYVAFRVAGPQPGQFL